MFCIVDDKCVWKVKAVCKLGSDVVCPVDCSLKDLVFEREAILARIVSEKKLLRKMFFFMRQRKKLEIRDKSCGVLVLYNVLEEHFGMPNVLKQEMNMIMTDDDRVKSVLKDFLG